MRTGNTVGRKMASMPWARQQDKEVRPVAAGAAFDGARSAAVRGEGEAVQAVAYRANQSR
ncbi:hypothetical protein CJF39_15530 [Pseudomonas lundensis]|uniref:Uncharacterized protein n=1 Tax=Pseudomonas lundensis TaxID=86185 RepID=A0A266N7V3_9PSED|nr:hypothetical protein CJF39_15530 [Pseudomonas lundensis]